MASVIEQFRDLFVFAYYEKCDLSLAMPNFRVGEENTTKVLSEKLRKQFETKRSITLTREHFNVRKTTVIASDSEAISYKCIKITRLPRAKALAMTSSKLTYSFNNKREKGQALRSELDIVCDTVTGRSMFERSELRRLEWNNTMSMNAASACGFLSVHFFCPPKESGRINRGNLHEIPKQVRNDSEYRRACL